MGGILFGGLGLDGAGVGFIESLQNPFVEFQKAWILPDMAQWGADNVCLFPLPGHRNKITVGLFDRQVSVKMEYPDGGMFKQRKEFLFELLVRVARIDIIFVRLEGAVDDLSIVVGREDHQQHQTQAGIGDGLVDHVFHKKKSQDHRDEDHQNVGQ